MHSGRGSPSPTSTSETNAENMQEINVDETTLQGMIQSFGPLEYTQFQQIVNQPRSTPAGLSDSQKARKETLMEWFDRSVEKQLRKKRDELPDSPVTDEPALDAVKHPLNLSKGITERLAETSASRIEIGSGLEKDFDTELADAVEQLVKAETMISYAEALQAAEEAALNAPPELAELAAAKEARRIQRGNVPTRNSTPGVRPIEVIGYVGVTKPRHPKK